jgi:hypothetical protein
MNASLMQEVEFGKAYIVQREKDFETMKAAMKNELRLTQQEYSEALTERIAVSKLRCRTAMGIDADDIPRWKRRKRREQEKPGIKRR